MRTYTCACGSRLFFENSLCLNCLSEVGFCPACRNLTGLVPLEGALFRCGNAWCSALLKKCENYVRFQVCNQCLLVTEPVGRDQPYQIGRAPANPAGYGWARSAGVLRAPDRVAPPAPTPVSTLCNCCRFNRTIPDLSVPGNQAKWYRLEVAKRRLIYDLDMMSLPYGSVSDGFQPGLAFDFKADVIPPANLWRWMGEQERVNTGYSRGTITINIREADEVERERLRVDFGEAHRTLTGHFRHEIGHYFWELLVQGKDEDAFKRLFGDHNDPPYAEALERYYQSGAPADWRSRLVSAYASMHPWEDFAETFSTYLDMVDTLDTATQMGLGGIGDPLHAFLDQMTVCYQQLGIAMNEMNRSMGLLDLMPEVLVTPVIEKLRYIHQRVVVAAGG